MQQYNNTMYTTRVSVGVGPVQDEALAAVLLECRSVLGQLHGDGLGLHAQHAVERVAHDHPQIALQLSATRRNVNLNQLLCSSLSLKDVCDSLNFVSIPCVQGSTE